MTAPTIRSVRVVLLGLALLLFACRSPSGCNSAPTSASRGAAIESSDPLEAGHVEPMPLDHAVVQDDAETAPGDLAEIKERGTLRVLITGTEESFLPRQGMPASHDRTLVKEFAARHGLRVQFLLVAGYDELLPHLEQGRGDLIAAQLTVTKERQARVAFTRPLHVVDELLIGRTGAQDAPKGPEDLANRTVHVVASAHAESLDALHEKAPGLAVEQVTGADAEELVWRVSQGTASLTVIDSHTLRAITAYNDGVQPLFTIAKGRQIAWAVHKDAPRLKGALDAFLIEKSLSAHSEELSTLDLEGIRKRGALRVLTRNNPVTYFLHKGEQRGFDYELARMFATELGVRLEMVVPPARDQLIPWLLDGRGDVIAASMTITPERSEQVAFSEPYLYVEEVLVQPTGAPRPASLADLRGRKIILRPTSSYAQSLKALAELTGPVELVPADESLETEQLIELVARDGGLTIADSHILKSELTFRDDVEMGLPLVAEPREAAWDDLTAGTRPIAFAVRPGNPELKEALDRFVKKTYRGLEYNMARNRYFENPRRISEAKTERVEVGGRLSPYDELIKKYSARYGLDWRLMAALAYQESRFDPNVTSWVGAVGLFQTMPSTAKEMGFDRPEDPEQSTHAGIKYLHYLVSRIDPTIPFKHRVRFALAAYNAGLGHVEDAQRLAAAQGLDPRKWFGHVEKAMLLLEQPQYYRTARHGYCRGSEPVKYVSQIQNRYDNYVKVMKL